MKFRTLKNWPDTASTSILLFFAQRMEELLFDYTLDTYKPSALNAPALCQEALVVLADIESKVLEASALTHVLDELEWSIHSDPVSKSLLEANLSRYLVRDDGVSIAEKKLKLEVLSGMLNQHRYFIRCVEFLEKAISNGDKKDVDLLARTLCTTLINLGQSKYFLYKEVVDYFYYDENSFVNSTDGFAGLVKRIYPYVHHFDVYFIVSSLINSIHEESEHFSVEKIDTIPEPASSFAAKNNFICKDGEVFVRVFDIEAHDVYSARADAEGRISKIRDLFVLFSHKAQLEWGEQALVVQKCCEELPAIVKKSRSSMEKGFDVKPPVASKRLNWMLGNMRLANDGSFQRFDRVVELHGVGVTNNIPENQLLNLWISIETITPTHIGQNKISGVILSIKSILMLNYISRLVERAASDLIGWDRHKTVKILKKVSQGKSIRLSLLKLLAVSENESVRNELYAALGDFYLLRHRIFSLAQVFSSRKKVREMLAIHEKKLAWQIRRIYRTRNLVVHSGKAPSFIHVLIENGHDYLDQIMSQIMLCSGGGYNLKNIDHVFEFSKIRLERFERLLAGDETFDSEGLEFLISNTFNYE